MAGLLRRRPIGDFDLLASSFPIGFENQESPSPPHLEMTECEWNVNGRQAICILGRYDDAEE